MNHWGMAVLVWPAMLFLALAMERHQETIWGRALPALPTYGLRGLGWGLLLASLIVVWLDRTPVLAWVAWFGYLTMAAATVLTGLSWHAHRR